MLAQDVRLEDPGSVVVELEHHAIELQHVFRRRVGGARYGATLDRLHVGRQVLRGCGRTQPKEHDRGRGRIDAASQTRIDLHGFPLKRAVTSAREYAPARGGANQLPSLANSAQLVAGRLVDG